MEFWAFFYKATSSGKKCCCKFYRARIFFCHSWSSRFMLRQWRKWLEKNSTGNQICFTSHLGSSFNPHLKNDIRYLSRILTNKTHSSIHPFFVASSDTSYQSHPIPQIGVGSLDICCFIFSTFGGSRYVCHGEGGITSVGSRRFGTSISGGLRFGSPDLWDVHVLGEGVFLLRL